MDLSELIEALSEPAAYPYAVETVDVRQTHISAVFLAGPFVYKVKKPVDLGFLDFGSLEQRRRFCAEEVRLNRRLAPHVYLGVVPVVRTAKGVRLEEQGEVVEWAVKMRRLPDEATLLARIDLRNANCETDREADFELVETLACRIASFHREAEANERTAAFGRFEAVSRIVLDVFDEARAQVGTTVSAGVFTRTKTLAQEALQRLRPLIEARAERGMPRDCHGDLHLDHVYHFPDQPPPGDLVIIDCIEFNERFRCIDPVADMAFPAMDLAFHGRRRLAQVFADAYFRAAGDEEGRALLPLYLAYRATVRGMVEGLELAEKEVSQAERAAALERARAHWLLALSELEAPERKPCLVLVAGLPGTGKSRLAQGLAKNAGFTVVRSDVLRKELAALSQHPRVQESLYTTAWNERTYVECLHRAERLLFEGGRVVVDATFRAERHRRLFLNAAVRWGVPVRMLLCQAEPETVRRRLEARKGDASDADWAVYLQVAANWEAISPFTNQAVATVLTEGSPEEALALALEALRQSGLHG